MRRTASSLLGKKLRLVTDEPVDFWEITGWSWRLQENYRSFSPVGFRITWILTGYAQKLSGSWQPATDEPVEFEKQPVQIPNFKENYWPIWRNLPTIPHLNEQKPKDVNMKPIYIFKIVSQPLMPKNLPGLMIGKNWQLVTNEPVEFEKWPVEVQDCRKFTDHFRGVYGIYSNLMKGNWRMWTCNRLDLQTLGSQPVILPKNLPDHCPGHWRYELIWSPCNAMPCHTKPLRWKWIWMPAHLGEAQGNYRPTWKLRS